MIVVGGLIIRVRVRTDFFGVHRIVSFSDVMERLTLWGAQEGPRIRRIRAAQRAFQDH